MRFQHALIVGKFAPPHRGHQHLIEAALAQAQQVTVLCYTVPDFVSMPSEHRARWLRELYPAIEVCVPQAAPPDDAGDEAQQRSYENGLPRAALRSMRCSPASLTATRSHAA
jgi:HTH-type transcriptional regulator, transcriptional repressor of NAD biosynthesis genes